MVLVCLDGSAMLILSTMLMLGCDLSFLLVLVCLGLVMVGFPRGARGA